MKVTRRLPILIGGVFALGLLAAACGGDAISDGGAEDSAAAAGATSAPRNITQSGTSNTYGVASDSAANESKGQAAPGGGSGGNTGGSPTGSLPSSSADFERKVIVNATMSLHVTDVPAAFSEANRLARAAGGYVERSSMSGVTGEKDTNLRATITLRVPAKEYDATLAGLRGIQGAKVQSEGAKSSEVTEQYVDLQSRLRNLERTEGQYLKLLEQAKTIPEILQMNDRLDSVRGQIEQIQGRLRVLDQLSELATIDVTMAPFPAAKAGDGNGSRSLGEVFVDAWEGSLQAVETVAAGAIYAGVALLWLALPVGLVLVAARRVFRRESHPPTVA